MADHLTLEYIIPKYNNLLRAHDYELNARIRLVDHLHSAGMKYRDIYALIENDPARVSAP